MWRAHVTGRPVSKESGIQINGLTARLARLYNGNAAFSVYQYGVAWVTVSADQPTTTVKWDDCQGKNPRLTASSVRRASSSACLSPTSQCPRGH